MVFFLRETIEQLYKFLMEAPYKWINWDTVETQDNLRWKYDFSAEVASSMPFFQEVLSNT